MARTIAMASSDRLGAALRRWAPWPHVVLFGGGGTLIILENLTWDRPDHALRRWIGVGVGVAAVVIGLLHLWASPATPE